MRTELMNTLYVQTQGSYLRLDHETLVVEAPEQDNFQIPLHHLSGMVLFGNVMVTPFLLHKCAEDQRNVTWFSTNGRFKARLVGPTSGNILLRRSQFETLGNISQTLALAQSFVKGKIRNARHVLQRALRDDGVRDRENVSAALQTLASHHVDCDATKDLDQLRGVEGNASAAYFSVFDALITSEDETLRFVERSRRPPLNRVNAMLSFAYSLLVSECVGALEGVGLDPQAGFLHALRPGRPALALDLMEEFRSVVADRAVLTLINRGQVVPSHFDGRTGGSVMLTEAGRKVFLRHWQERKSTSVQHQGFEQSVPLGLLPHIQARILARTLRGDLKNYVPFAAR
jgi:CRISP-associated protein Cas1